MSNVLQFPTPDDEHDELFEPLLTGLSPEQRVERACSSAKAMFASAMVAGEIVHMDKAELLAKIAKDRDLWCSIDAELRNAKARANQLASLLWNAQTRLAVLLDLPIDDFDHYYGGDDHDSPPAA